MASLPHPPSCTAQFSRVSPLLPTDSAASYSNSALYVYHAMYYILISHVAVRNARDGILSNEASLKVLDLP